MNTLFKNSFCIIFLLVLYALPTQAQYISWQTVIGETTLDEEMDKIIELADGSLVTVGRKNTLGANTNYLFYLIKHSTEGSIAWETVFGGNGDDVAVSFCEAGDGGFIVVGSTLSTDGTVGIARGAEDWLITKFDSEGDLVWTKILGGTGEDEPGDIVAMGDGTYVIAGYTESNDMDITENKGAKDLWLVKIAENGDVIWQKTYGGTASEQATALKVRPNTNHLVVGGATASTDFDIDETQGSRDFWVLEVEPDDGTLLWQDTYGGSESDGIQDLVLTPDGGTILLGDSRSNDGQVGMSFGQDDMWVIKIDEEGTLLWSYNIGNPGFEHSKGITLTDDGNVAIVGATLDWTVAPPNYFYDVWITKLTEATGELLWDDTFGGSQYDFGNDIIQCSDGTLAIAGYTDSADGDVDGGGFFAQSEVHGNDNVWVFKVHDPIMDTGIENSPSTIANIYPNPFQNHFTLTIATPLAKNTFVKVYDLTGKLLFSKKINCPQADCQATLNMEAYTAATYFVEICADGQCDYQKIVKGF